MIGRYKAENVSSLTTKPPLACASTWAWQTLTQFSLAEAIAVLGRTPATLMPCCADCPTPGCAATKGNDTWSAFGIVGHLIVGERTD